MCWGTRPGVQTTHHTGSYHTRLVPPEEVHCGTEVFKISYLVTIPQIQELGLGR